MFVQYYISRNFCENWFMYCNIPQFLQRYWCYRNNLTKFLHITHKRVLEGEFKITLLKSHLFVFLGKLPFNRKDTTLLRKHKCLEWTSDMKTSCCSKSKMMHEKRRSKRGWSWCWRPGSDRIRTGFMACQPGQRQDDNDHFVIQSFMALLAFGLCCHFVLRMGLNLC